MKYGPPKRQSGDYEIAYIGNHPTGYSYLKHVVVLLTNEQAIEAMERGYHVRISAKDSKFLGAVNQEHQIYLVIDVPQNFPMDKIRQWRLNSYAAGTSNAIVEFIESPWEFDDGSKKGVRLYLRGIYMAVDKEEDDEVDDEELETLYSASYADCLDGVRRRENEATNYRTLAKDTRRPARARFERGDVFAIDGEEYVIGHIQENIHDWSLRLDRKFRPSRFVRFSK
jgi:hypothetical protein